MSVLSTILCCGCKNLYSSDDLNECRLCGKFICSTCSCSCNPKPSSSVLISKAKDVIGSFIYRTPALCAADANNFIIEDEFGGLEAVNGCISEIIQSTPVLDEIFADQLPAEVAKEYEGRQLSIWSQGIVAGSVFTMLGWKIMILPLFVAAERYTVSVFLDSTINLF